MILVPLARRVLDVAGLVPHLESVRAARAGDEAVGRARPPARDAPHRVPLADHVRIDSGGREHLLSVEASAGVPAVVPRTPCRLVVSAEVAGPGESIRG